MEPVQHKVVLNTLTHNREPRGWPVLVNGCMPNFAKPRSPRGRRDAHCRLFRKGESDDEDTSTLCSCPQYIYFCQNYYFLNLLIIPPVDVHLVFKNASTLWPFPRQLANARKDFYNLIHFYSRWHVFNVDPSVGAVVALTT